MKIRNTVGLLILTALPLSASAASERTNEAISQCIEHAEEQFEVASGKAHFWQMSQAGRYIRIWLKMRNGDDEMIKAMCKVSKNQGEITDMKRIGS